MLFVEITFVYILRKKQVNFRANNGCDVNCEARMTSFQRLIRGNKDGVWTLQFARSLSLGCQCYGSS